MHMCVCVYSRKTKGLSNCKITTWEASQQKRERERAGKIERVRSVQISEIVPKQQQEHKAIA